MAPSLALLRSGAIWFTWSRSRCSDFSNTPSSNLTRQHSSLAGASARGGFAVVETVGRDLVLEQDLDNMGWLDRGRSALPCF